MVLLAHFRILVGLMALFIAALTRARKRYYEIYRLVVFDAMHRRPAENEEGREIDVFSHMPDMGADVSVVFLLPMGHLAMPRGLLLGRGVSNLNCAAVRLALSWRDLDTEFPRRAPDVEVGTSALALSGACARFTANSVRCKPLRTSGWPKILRAVARRV